jgi:hypothetical protein
MLGFQSMLFFEFREQAAVRINEYLLNFKLKEFNLSAGKKAREMACKKEEESLEA